LAEQIGWDRNVILLALWRQLRKMELRLSAVGQQDAGRRFDIIMAHQMFADEESVDARSAHPGDVLRSGDAAFTDERGTSGD
jgi:hypothetical protein